VDSQLSVARAFIDAVRAKNDRAAAALCADDIEVLLPGANAPLKGKEGVRQMVNHTTWIFVFEGNKIARLSFELRAAN
jgi:ketosteroid isomerase-like protein